MCCRVIVYTAWTFRSYDLTSNLNAIVLLIFVPSAICGVLFPLTRFSTESEDSMGYIIVFNIYAALRIFSIVFNIVCYFLLKKQLNNIMKMSVGTGQLTPASNTPLHALAARFKYYPIVQVLSRLGVSYYHRVYGLDYNYDSSSSLEKKLAFLWYAISYPSAGLGFFIVYLVVTPGAYLYCRTHLCACCQRVEDAQVGILNWRKHIYQSSRSSVTESDYRAVQQSEASGFLSLYSQWSDQDLHDEVSCCFSRNTEGDCVIEDEHEYLHLPEKDGGVEHKYLSFKRRLGDDDSVVSCITQAEDAPVPHPATQAPIAPVKPNR